jgi:hypothetical protein
LLLKIKRRKSREGKEEMRRIQIKKKRGHTVIKYTNIENKLLKINMY